MDVFSIQPMVDRLLTHSAMFIDRDDLDAWLDCFEEESKYIVLPRENRILGLPVGIIHCDSKASLKDRILCLRHANKFNAHFDRHIVGSGCVMSLDGDVATVESNFMVVQTTKTGESRLFCAGCYEDRIRISDRAAKFVERIAVLDTFSVPTLLATPV
jgi:anthranilate 1,2-dioxygenase small subunit